MPTDSTNFEPKINLLASRNVQDRDLELQDQDQDRKTFCKSKKYI